MSPVVTDLRFPPLEGYMSQPWGRSFGGRTGAATAYTLRNSVGAIGWPCPEGVSP